MARARDETKRSAIMLAAKHLFAHQGFHKTSISDIKRECGLPVGSIYTYFASKDDIMSAIIAEGWEELYQRINLGFGAAKTLDQRIEVLTAVFFVDLVRDSELISILLTEAIELTRIADKLDRIVELILSLLPADAANIPARSAGNIQLRSAVVVYFLGFLHATRLSQSGQIGIHQADIQAFMRQLIVQGLQRPSLPDSGADSQ